MERDTLIAGKYRVRRVLGRGGMATVYLAKHEDLGSLHAIKVLEAGAPEPWGMLVGEGRAQAGLRHPNLVAVTDLVHVGGHPALVMEYVDGTTLRAVLNRGLVPVDEALGWFSGVLRGVAVVHAAQLVHRDLKPSNIFMTTVDGVRVPKVGDFGLVQGSAQESDGGIFGTPAYMAPEQARGEALDTRADIFALGSILYELMTGRPAFGGESPQEVMHAVRTGRVHPPERHRTGIPPTVLEGIRVALSVDPAGRWPSCDAFRRALEGPASPSLHTRWVFDSAAFRAARLEFGLTQEAASEELGIPLRTLRRLDNGEINRRGGGFRLQTPRTVAMLSAIERQWGLSRDTLVREERDEITRAPAAVDTMAPSRSFEPVVTAHLPERRGLFLGREAEVARLRSWMCQDRGLLTVCGPGGMGKTELVRQAMEGVSLSVAWVDVRRAVDGEDIARLTAGALGLDRHVADLEALLADRGAFVLVLDNLEQALPTAVPTLRRWLNSCPDLRIVATSRTQVELVGEQVLELGPLAEEEAEELLRRSAAQPPGPAETAQIVQAVDRMPLAIVLAASRLALLSPRQLLTRLRRQHDVLRRRGDHRHDALRTSMEESWNGLEAHDRAILSAIASLGSRSVAIGCAEAAGQTDLDTLMALRVRSWLHAPKPGRVAMYEPMRAFAVEQAGSLTPTAVAERVLPWCLEFAETCQQDLRERYDEEVARLLDGEGELFCSVFEHTLSQMPEEATRLLLSMWRTPWDPPGGVSSEARRLERALELVVHPASVAELHARLARVSVHLDQADRAATHVEQGMELVRRHDLPGSEGTCWYTRGVLLSRAMDRPAAVAAFERAADCLERAGRSVDAWVMRANIATARAVLEPAAARRAITRALESLKGRAPFDTLGVLHVSLAALLAVGDDATSMERSLTHFRRGGNLLTEAGMLSGAASALVNRASTLVELGRLEGAAPLLAEAERRQRLIGRPRARVMTRLVQARRDAETGDLLGAASHVSAAIAQAELLDVAARVRVHSVSVLVALLRGDSEAAAVEGAEALALGPVGWRLQHLRVLQAIALARAERVDAARALLARIEPVRPSDAPMRDAVDAWLNGATEEELVGLLVAYAPFRQLVRLLPMLTGARG